MGALVGRVCMCDRGSVRGRREYVCMCDRGRGMCECVEGGGEGCMCEWEAYI